MNRRVSWPRSQVLILIGRACVARELQNPLQWAAGGKTSWVGGTVHYDTRLILRASFRVT